MNTPLTLAEICKKLPEGLDSHFRDASAFAAGTGKKLARSRNAGCYAGLWRPEAVQTGKARVELIRAVQRYIPRSQIKKLSPEEFKKLFAFYKKQKFFPPKSAAVPDEEQEGDYKVVIQPGTYDSLRLKIAAFMFRYIDTYPMFAATPVVQYEYLKNTGVSFLQCFQWAGVMLGVTGSHGIFTFHVSRWGSYGANPYLPMALAYILNSSTRELSEYQELLQYAPERADLEKTIIKTVLYLQGTMPLTAKLTYAQQGAFYKTLTGKKPDSLLDPELGQFYQKPRVLRRKERAAVINALPSTTPNELAKIYDSYDYQKLY